MTTADHIGMSMFFVITVLSVWIAEVRICNKLKEIKDELKRLK